MVETEGGASTAVLLGVGGLGCRIVADCRKGRLPRWLVDFDEGALAGYPPGETFHLLGDPDDADPVASQLAERAVAEGLGELVDRVEGEPFVVLVGAIGRATGALVLPGLAREFKAARCPTVVVALEPLPFEGAARADVATRTLDDLVRTADLVLPVPNRPLGEICDPALPVHQALARLTEKTRDALGHLLDALTDASCIGLQPAELRRAVVDAGRGAFGVGVGRGDRRVEVALRDACAGSFLSPESCRRASAAVLHLRGGKDLSLQEINSASELVGALVGHVTLQACLSTCDEAGDAVRALLLVTGIRSPETDAPNGELPAASDRFEDLSFYDGVNLDVPAYVRRKTTFRMGR
jgi:cell division protein FtsZ